MVLGGAYGPNCKITRLGPLGPLGPLEPLFSNTRNEGHWGYCSLMTGEQTDGWTLPSTLSRG